MTVYVDNMRAPYKPKHAHGRTYVMSHMIADTEAELHAMADRIGVLRKWFQGDHYDITQTKRALAIEHGAVAISTRILSHMAVSRRNGQKTLMTPAEAEKSLQARIERLRRRLSAK